MATAVRYYVGRKMEHACMCLLRVERERERASTTNIDIFSLPINLSNSVQWYYIHSFATPTCPCSTNRRRSFLVDTFQPNEIAIRGRSKK